MPVNENMESILQEKMEDFLLEPDPADWRAIQERLRKKRRRRFLWWVFPLAGAAIIGTGAYLYTGGQADQIPAALSALPATAPNETARKGTHKQATPEIIVSTEQEETPDTKIPEARHTNPTRSTATPMQQNGTKPTVSAPMKNADDQSRIPAKAMELEPYRELAAIDAYRARPSWLIPATLLPLTTAHRSVPTANLPNPEVTEKSIPTKNITPQKGWYLGAYLSLGRNHPYEPINTGKALDFNSGPGVSGSTSYTRGMASRRPGLHSSAGLAIRKKHKKTAFSIGLGLQHNTWEQSYSIYKDSITPTGNLYTRATVASPNQQYRQLMMEVPLIAEFRIAGRKASSWWIHTGLNNAIALDLSEKSQLNNLTSIPGAAGTGNAADSLLKTNSSGYIPQLRFGLSYEHAMKQQHWQLQPYMQLGLRSVTSSGEPDVSLFQWGLQFRYFFKKIK